MVGVCLFVVGVCMWGRVVWWILRVCGDYVCGEENACVEKCACVGGSCVVQSVIVWWGVCGVCVCGEENGW